MLKKNIVILLAMKPEEGGKFQYSICLLDALCSLDKNKYNIISLYNDNNWENYLSDSIKKYHLSKNLLSLLIKKFVFIFFGGFKTWRYISKYFDPAQKMINKIRPHLVFFPGGYGYSFELNVPAIVSVFDLMHRYESSFPEVSKKGIYRKREYFYKNISKYSLAILVDSIIGKEQFIESYKTQAGKIFVLPYVAPKYIYELKAKDCREKYKLPNEYIFYPAQFWKHKNHINLLKALNLLKEKGIRINAVFVGSRKNYYYEIKELIDELKLNDQIWILDYVSNEELIFLYKNAIALVMPTFFGPTNIPQLEAFALGCPVITSNIYGIPEQVGDAALLVDPYDEKDIAEKIKHIINNPELRKCLIKKGYENNNKWNISQYSKLLENIVSALI